jgi:zona occludens toxin
MLLFHEGMPRSGKSYEATAFYIIPAIQKGRLVDAYVDGLKHEQIAEIAEVPLEQVQELLKIITEEQVPEIYKHVRQNSLVVIDELQNFFPNGRQKLHPDIQNFITKHGHDGHDILCMGQDLRDCHAVWRRRVSQKTFFLKLEAVGQPDRYQWATYKATRPEHFEKVTSGIRKYDPKYFGSYASHSEGTTNTEQFMDTRANVLKTKVAMLVPVALVAVVGLAFYIKNSVFAAPSQPVPEVVQESPVSVPSLEEQFNEALAPLPEPLHETKVEPEVPEFPELDPVSYVYNLAKTNKARLAGYARIGDRLVIEVEILNNSGHKLDVFRGEELESMGWTLDLKDYGLVMSADNLELFVRPWPNDPLGKIPRQTIDAL